MREYLGGLPDFLRAVSLRDYVLIVGSGPSARAVSPEFNPRWEEIVEGHSIIIVNGAPDVPGADIYMALDENCPKYEWYRAGRARHYLLENALARKAVPPNQPYYTFEMNPALQSVRKPGREPWECYAKYRKPRILHNGSTIITPAYQLALQYPNVKAINLIGCEMTNGEWWDHATVYSRIRDRSGIDCVNMLMDYAEKARGITTHHIGPTRLYCYMVRPEDFYATAPK